MMGDENIDTNPFTSNYDADEYNAWCDQPLTFLKQSSIHVHLAIIALHIRCSFCSVLDEESQLPANPITIYCQKNF